MLVLAAVVFVSRSTTAQLIASLQRVAHAHAVIEGVEALRSRVGAVESDGRGFLLTGDERLLARHEEAVRVVPGLCADLRRLTNDDPAQLRRLDALEPLVAEKLAWSERVVGIARRSGPAAATQAVRSGRGVVLMRDAERVMLDMNDAERRVLSARDADARARAQTSLRFTLWGGVLTAALLAGAQWLILRDLRRRRRAEEESERLRRFLDSIVENIPNMIFVKDAASLRFVRFNRAGEDLLGHSRGDLIGRNDHDFFPKEQADFFTAKDRAVLAGGTVVDIPEEAIETRHQGRRLLHTRKVPVFDRDGQPAYLLGISEDITERRQWEERVAALNESMRRHALDLAEANRELEAFSYSVSHDLRAPLRHIVGFADLLDRHAGPRLDETGRRQLGTIVAAATRMGELIDDLLVFSRMGRGELMDSPVEVAAIVNEVIEHLDGELVGRQVRWEIAALPVARGDPAMLRIVFSNLISNAVKYTRPRKEAVIRIESHVAKGEVVYSVADNGVGFDMAYVHKLFGVFQRLHGGDEFEGTGIGLATVRRIVHRHGGRTWAEGAVGSGATLYFSLPSAGEIREAA